jgi:hypothetical protein
LPQGSGELVDHTGKRDASQIDLLCPCQREQAVQRTAEPVERQ